MGKHAYSGLLTLFLTKLLQLCLASSAVLVCCLKIQIQGERLSPLHGERELTESPGQAGDDALENEEPTCNLQQPDCAGGEPSEYSIAHGLILLASGGCCGSHSSHRKLGCSKQPEVPGVRVAIPARFCPQDSTITVSVVIGFHDLD